MKTTINKPQYIISKRGMKELKKSIQNLEHDLNRARLNLRELDKSSSHDATLARVEKLTTLELIEEALASKKQLLASAKLLPSKRARLQVALGSIVDLIDQQGRLFRYTLVDSFEANPSDGRISIASPLGKTLIDKKIQDIIEWSNGTHVNKLQLVRIM